LKQVKFSLALLGLVWVSVAFGIISIYTDYFGGLIYSQIIAISLGIWIGALFGCVEIILVLKKHHYTIIKAILITIPGFLLGLYYIFSTIGFSLHNIGEYTLNLDYPELFSPLYFGLAFFGTSIGIVSIITIKYWNYAQPQKNAKMAVAIILCVLLSMYITGIILYFLWDLLNSFTSFGGLDETQKIYHFQDFILLNLLSFNLMLLILTLILHKNQIFVFQLSNLKKKELLTKIGVCFYILTVLFGLLAPFIIQPANIAFETLPPRPKILGHRGASGIAPENTLVCGQRIVEIGAYGWEIDVQISIDGIPFLMHDTTLMRTTNIEDIFPDRKNEPASNFTWAELQELDAGRWFIEKDPFGMIKSGEVTQAYLNDYQNVSIPSLQEIISFSKDHQLAIDFDFKSPLSSHPYYATFRNICWDLLLQAELDQNITIWWHSTPPGTNNSFLTEDVYNPQYFMTNDEYIQYETDSQRKLMIWTMNDEKRFQQLWALGVDYIKTDIPHRLMQIQEPPWHIPKTQYYLGLIALIAFESLIYAILVKKQLRPSAMNQ
jgi:glycerophosphoryl diester phosphodiesterase